MAEMEFRQAIPQVEILADRPSLVARAFELTIAAIQAAIAERGRCVVALSGGTTPEPLYQDLAKADLPWQNLWILWGDERYVPPDHPDSNQRSARLAWLNHVPIPPGQILAMPTASGDPAQDAARYEATLADRLGYDLGSDDFPGAPLGPQPGAQIDLILLGMGDDGHTASLFPGTSALGVRDRLVTVGEKDGQPRLTLTYPLLNRGRLVIFLVAGASKRPALAQVFAACDDPMLSVALDLNYPARAIRPQGELIWLLDRAAGDCLDPHGERDRLS